MVSNLYFVNCKEDHMVVGSWVKEIKESELIDTYSKFSSEYFRVKIGYFWKNRDFSNGVIMLNHI